MQEDGKKHSKNRSASSPAPTGLISSAAVYTAPVLFTLLVGTILLFLAYVTFDQEALGRLLNSVQWPLSLIVHALLIILTIALIILFMITPALTAFLVNLKYLVLTNWGKAIISGVLFFLFCILIISIAIFYHSRVHNTELTQYYLLLIYGLLFSSLLSLSVLLFGALALHWAISAAKAVCRILERRDKMRKGKKVILIGFVLFFLMLTFFVGAPSAPVNAAPPPWSISVTPKKVFSAPPNCSVSFIINVSSSYDKPVQIIFDEKAEGDWPFQPGTLLSSVHFDGKGGNMPVSANYKTVVTVSIVAPWEKPPGEYRVRVYAFPEGTDPYQYGVYDIITIVIVDTGVEKCDPDYWPPPPSDEDLDIINDWDEDWPPPFDDGTDIITDETDGWHWWRWWRWWRLDWKWWRWWRYPDQSWRGNWWYRWWPWANGEDRETKQSFDFSLTVTPSLQSIEPGESTYFTTNVEHLSGDAQSISLSVSGLPAGAVSSFSVSSAQPSFSSSLSVSTETLLPPGTYPLTVTGSGGGKTHSVNVNIVVDEGRGKSVLSVSVNPPATQTDETVSVSGALSPPLAVPIELIYTRPDGFEMTKQVRTSSEGTFTDSFSPDLTGFWSIRARWAGDEERFGSESQPVSLSVKAAPGQPSIWEMIIGILTLIIFIAVIIALIYLLIHRVRRSKAGNPIQAASGAKYCMQCGASIPEVAKFCPQCGNKTK